MRPLSARIQLPGAGMTKDGRHHVRVTGPFDGCRVGPFDMPVLIHDLSEGGCFVNWSHDSPDIGRKFTLRIDLPEEGSITVLAETLYARPDFGYAVRFVDVPVDTRLQLIRLIQSIRERPPDRGSRID